MIDPTDVIPLDHGFIAILVRDLEVRQARRAGRCGTRTQAGHPCQGPLGRCPHHRRTP